VWVIPDWKKFISSGENIIRFLGDYIAKYIRQNSSLQEGQSLYLAGLFSNPETVKMLNQNGMLDCTVVWQAHKKRCRFGSTVPFCLFDRVLNVISIKDIDDNGCKLYNPSTRSKLKSFEDMTHKTKLKCRSGDTVNPELVFSRELVLANCREDVTVEKVLSFPIGPIPT
jgi:hypothetical protein